MDMLDNLKCPQYVNFSSDIQEDGSLKGLEYSPSMSSVKDDVQSENMDTEDENSYLQDHSHLGSLQSSFSNSYLDSNAQESTMSLALSSPMEDYPVNRPKNLSLPDQLPKKNKKVYKTTKVQPFHFAEHKKRKRENEESEHIPLAEQVAAFHKKTPQRFHTKGLKGYEPAEHWSPTITHPKSPNLQAAKRQRRVDVISREEQEAKEVEEMKRYRFRARPLNRSLLYKPQLLNVGKKTPTKPKAVQLRTAHRAAEIYSKKKTDEKPYEFRARPVPKAILNGPTGLKEKPSLPITEAKTPNFALKKRAEKWKTEKLNETVTETQRFKAMPVPDPSSPFTVKHEKKLTVMQPFSFDSRDKERMAHKERKVMEEIEKENAVFQFKAQPMPSPTPSTLPAVPKKTATLPQPFNFQLEERSSRHSSFNSTMEMTGPVFKAQPATVLEKAPFVPEKLNKPPVEVKEFHLYTDIRASERQKLKEINDFKEHEKELALQRLKEFQEEEERKEIQKLRREIVHKANPIRHYKPVEIKPSSKPPTEPMSPKFKTDERLQQRH